PEPDADGAPRLGADGLENAHRFHHHGDASAVIGGARSSADAIEVRAEEYELARRIRTRQIAEHVETVRLRLVEKPGFHVELDLHRHAFVENSDDPVVMLDGERHCRNDLSGVRRIARAACAWENG